MLTIAYFTNRRDPKFKWFCDSLVTQLAAQPAIQLEVIFIDALAWDTEIDRTASEVTPYVSADRAAELINAVGGRFAFQHLPPKPTVWQGPFRLTSRDWFAASNARNTALIAAHGKYFVGVDDLTVLMPGWLSNVLHAAAHGYCVCGAYRKDRQMVVENGELISSVRYALDTRWDQGSDSGMVTAAGSWLYGCSFGIPLDLALSINGFDEICDAQGAEDYDFGIRASRAGGLFYYNRNMLTVESEEGHHLDAPMPRQSKLVTPAYLPADYSKNPMSDHVLLNRLMDEHRTQSLGTPDLRKIRARFFETGQLPVPKEPTTDWRDGTPLSSY